MVNILPEGDKEEYLDSLPTAQRLENEVCMLVDMEMFQKHKYLKKVGMKKKEQLERAMLEKMQPLKRKKYIQSCEAGPAQELALMNSMHPLEQKQYLKQKVREMNKDQWMEYCKTLPPRTKAAARTVIWNDMSVEDNKDYLEWLPDAERELMEEVLLNTLTPEDWDKYLHSITPEHRLTALGAMLDSWPRVKWVQYIEHLPTEEYVIAIKTVIRKYTTEDWLEYLDVLSDKERVRTKAVMVYQMKRKQQVSYLSFLSGSEPEESINVELKMINMMTIEEQGIYMNSIKSEERVKIHTRIVSAFTDDERSDYLDRIKTRYRNEYLASLPAKERYQQQGRMLKNMSEEEWHAYRQSLSIEDQMHSIGMRLAVRSAEDIRQAMDKYLDDDDDFDITMLESAMLKVMLPKKREQYFGSLSRKDRHISEKLYLRHVDFEVEPLKLEFLREKEAQMLAHKSMEERAQYLACTAPEERLEKEVAILSVMTPEERTEFLLKMDESRITIEAILMARAGPKERDLFFGFCSPEEKHEIVIRMLARLSPLQRDLYMRTLPVEERESVSDGMISLMSHEDCEAFLLTLPAETRGKLEAKTLLSWSLDERVKYLQHLKVRSPEVQVAAQERSLHMLVEKGERDEAVLSIVRLFEVELMCPSSIYAFCKEIDGPKPREMEGAMLAAFESFYRAFYLGHFTMKEVNAFLTLALTLTLTLTLTLFGGQAQRSCHDAGNEQSTKEEVSSLT